MHLSSSATAAAGSCRGRKARPANRSGLVATISATSSFASFAIGTPALASSSYQCMSGLSERTCISTRISSIARSLSSGVSRGFGQAMANVVGPTEPVIRPLVSRPNVMP